MKRQKNRLILTLALLLAAVPTLAEELLHVSIKDHKFVPDRLDAPAGIKFKLLITNQDDTAAEFESFALNREKVVPAGLEVPVFLGPLDHGEYAFFDDFHQDTKGLLIVK